MSKGKKPQGQKPKLDVEIIQPEVKPKAEQLEAPKELHNKFHKFIKKD